MDKKNSLDKKNFKSMISLNFPYNLSDLIEKEYSKFLDSLEKMIEDFHIIEQDKPSFKQIGEDIFNEKLNDITNSYRKSITNKGKKDFIQSIIDTVKKAEEDSDFNSDMLNSIQESIKIAIFRYRFTDEEIDILKQIVKEKIPNFAKKIELSI